MREIKFRAWTGRVMINNVGVVPNVASDELMCCRDAYDKLETIHAEALMQYTGLKDKNGVEVYESDIVKHEHGALGVVEYDVESASFQTGSSRCVYDQENGLDYETLEVIGNRFENPELLEAI